MLKAGDIVERALRSVGVTKELVQAITGREDCGCNKRQAEMNDWGYRWQYRLLFCWQWLQYQLELLKYSRVGRRLNTASHHFYYGLRVLFYGR